MRASRAFAPATFARPVAATRLLVIQARSRSFFESSHAELPRRFSAGDVLVVNDAATIPASIFGETARGEPLELRLTSLPDATGACDAVVLGKGDWHTPTERRAPPPSLAPNDRIHASGLFAVVVRSGTARRVRVRFEGNRGDTIARLYASARPVQYAHIERPLPLWEVQNIYAAEPWAAEMPSAGRAIDFEVLDALRKRGVTVARVTHSAGLSSIGDGALDAALPWTERYRIPEETAAAITQAPPGARIVAVGTSVVRALETSAAAFGEVTVAGSAARRDRTNVSAGEATTDLRIDARHRLRVVSALLTGMHDPGSSHADLLSAFVPHDLLSEASAFAAARGFLGHELGDSCLILDE